MISVTSLRGGLHREDFQAGGVPGLPADPGVEVPVDGMGIRILTDL